jgi:ArsR family transcriptional regulator
MSDDASDRADWTSILKAFAHPVRLMILDELLRNPRCVTAIREILEVRQPNISQHLTVLRNSGLVASRQDGSYRCYYLPRPGLVKAVFEAIGKDWPETAMEKVREQFRTALKKRLNGKK